MPLSRRGRCNQRQLTVQMRQVVDVALDILRITAELLQAQLEYAERNFLVLAAVVFHQSGRHKYVIPRSDVLACLLEHGTGRFDAFGATGELHVLHVGLCGR